MPQKNEISKTVLVTVLDWGLGHATRTIPIIQCLERAGAKVVMASAGHALTVLRQRFPDLSYYELPGYHIKYPTSNMFWNVGYQMPKIISVIIREFFVIHRIVQLHNVDIIISDNRYGCFSWRRHSIFMTHQLYIQSGVKWLDPLLKWVHLSWIRLFDECWIPDFPDGIKLAGDLAHPKPNDRFQYIGILSRLEKLDLKIEDFVLVLLSGPEPQRSQFEDKLLTALSMYAQKTVLIRGLPKADDNFKTNLPHVEVIPFLSGKPLNELIQRAKMVICRSGYSSMMDLVSLKKRALLVPTPGQTEQLYLAQLATKNMWYFHQHQEALDLPYAFSQIANYKPPRPNDLTSEKVLQSTIDRLIKVEKSNE